MGAKNKMEGLILHRLEVLYGGRRVIEVHNQCGKIECINKILKDSNYQLDCSKNIGYAFIFSWDPELTLVALDKFSICSPLRVILFLAPCACIDLR